MRLPFTAVLAAAVSSLAQPAVARPQATAWDAGFSAAPLPFLEPIELASLPDGGAVAVSLGWVVAPRTGDAQIVAVGLTANGDQRWSRNIPSPADDWGLIGPTGQQVSAATDGQGNLYLAYSLPQTSWLVSLTIDGAQRWAREVTSPLGLPDHHVSALCVASNGDVFVAGSAYDPTFPQLAVHAFDAAGNLRWVSTPGAGYAHAIAVAPDGWVYLGGQDDWFGSFQFDPLFVSLRPDGSLALRQTQGSGQWNAVRHVTVNAGGDVVALASGSTSSLPGVLQLIRVGSAQWLDLGTSLSALVAVRDLALTANGDALIAADDGAPRLLHVAAGTNIVSTWGLPSVLQGRVHAVAATTDGGALVTGVTGGSGSATFDARFDATGQPLWSSLRPGFAPISASAHTIAGEFDLDIVLDSRGNALVSNSRPAPGGAPGTWLGVAKFVDGGPLGAAYCGPAVPNSTGASAVITALGSALRSDDNLTLLASGLPGGTTAYFLVGPQQAYVAQPGGSAGNLCLGGAIGRHVGLEEVRLVRADGTTSLQLDLDSLPRPTGPYSAAAGETWNFQGWYRDVLGGVATSNFTDAVGVLLN